MGFFKSLLKQGEALLDEHEKKKKVQQTLKEDPPTRWEKAVLGLSGIVNQVAPFDSNGIDVVCFPGISDNVDIYRNMKDTTGLKEMVMAKEPSGSCNMGEALDLVFKEATERGFEKSTSILVLTAGKPEDYSEVEDSIKNMAASLENEKDLSITFVQIGDDEKATFFLKELDSDIITTSASGEKIDIVDTIKDEDIKKAMKELQDPGFMGQGGTGALLGGIAGAALGAGGMYLYNKSQAKKRTEGWNGDWKATLDGEEIAMLKVIDDMEQNISIVYSEEVTTTGYYFETDEGYNITRIDEKTGRTVVGTVEDDHNISWSDGTHWEEVVPGKDWAAIAAAGAAGATVAGGVGYVTHKKFFNKASNKEPSDYVIVLDRSAMMDVVDTGK